jgi:hypothetical protein
MCGYGAQGISLEQLNSLVPYPGRQFKVFKGRRTLFTTVCTIIPSSMAGDTIMSISERVTSGRWHSTQIEEPLVMYFSLTNSLAIFQTMMNEIFQDLITEGVVSIYLDNLRAMSTTFSESLI